MFTGLIEAVGTIREREPHDEGLRFRVRAELGETLEAGESITVDGACQTVTEAQTGQFGFESIRTTLARTTLSELRPGRRVNLERALRAGDRLGGHLVQGHVDAVGSVLEVRPEGETVFVRIRLPEEVARCCVPRGSLAVDGVSLTLSELRDTVAEVAIIPYTWKNTALDRLAPGDRVNLEADLVGKYVRKLVRPYRSGRSVEDEDADHSKEEIS